MDDPDIAEWEAANGGSAQSDPDLAEWSAAQASPIEQPSPELPDSTGSFFGDAVDAYGGFGSNALRDFATTVLKPADWIANEVNWGLDQLGVPGAGNTLGGASKPTDLISKAFDVAYGDTGQQSAVGREFSRAGELTGTAGGLLTGLGAAKAIPYLGKAAKFLSSNPLAQLEASATGGLLGQLGAEEGLYERGGTGQTIAEIGSMVGPDALRGGANLVRAAIQPIRRRVYQNAPEAAMEVFDTAAHSLDEPAVLWNNYGSASAQAGRESRLGELVKSTRNEAGQEIQTAREAIGEASPEVQQLMDRQSQIRRELKFGTLSQPERQGLLGTLDEIDGQLASIPERLPSQYPLLNEATGDFFTGVTPARNELPGLVQRLENSKGDFSELADDLYRVFRTGRYSGRGVSLEDYQDAASRIGAHLSTPQRARTFREVMGENPEALSIGKSSILQNVFSGTPTSWISKINRNRGAMQELFTPEQIRGLEAVARKNENLVGGLMVSQPLRFLGRKLTVASGIAGAAFGNIPGFLGGVALSRAARAIAEKPREMQVALSRAFQSPEAATLLHAEANPQNIRRARDFFTNAGKNAIMGTANEAINKSEKLDSTIIPSDNGKKKVDRVSPGDVDLDKPATKDEISAIKDEIDSDPVDSAIFAMESSRGKKLDNPASTAQGWFQLIKKTARDLGVKDVNNPRQNYEGYLKLKDEARRAGADTPEDFYAYHFLGGPLYRKWKRGAKLEDEDDRANVRDLEYVLLPRFRGIYNNNKHYKGKITKV